MQASAARSLWKTFESQKRHLGKPRLHSQMPTVGALAKHCPSLGLHPDLGGHRALQDSGWIRNRTETCPSLSGIFRRV